MTMPTVELEGRVDRALKRLPQPRAPRTLLPRVLAAVQQWSVRPWYERAWLTWPLGWQALSMVALALVIGGTVVLLPRALALAAAASASTLSWPSGESAARALSVLAATARAGRAIWEVLVQPFLPYVFALVMLMWLACGIFAAALNRAVFGKALHS
jgi:hypothetical protein